MSSFRPEKSDSGDHCKNSNHYQRGSNDREGFNAQDDNSNSGNVNFNLYLHNRNYHRPTYHQYGSSSQHHTNRTFINRPIYHHHVYPHSRQYPPFNSNNNVSPPPREEVPPHGTSSHNAQNDVHTSRKHSKSPVTFGNNSAVDSTGEKSFSTRSPRNDERTLRHRWQSPNRRNSSSNDSITGSPTTYASSLNALVQSIKVPGKTHNNQGMQHVSCAARSNSKAPYPKKKKRKRNLSERRKQLYRERARLHQLRLRLHNQKLADVSNAALKDDKADIKTNSLPESPSKIHTATEDVTKKVKTNVTDDTFMSGNDPLPDIIQDQKCNDSVPSHSKSSLMVGNSETIPEISSANDVVMTEIDDSLIGGNVSLPLNEKRSSMSIEDPEINDSLFKKPILHKGDESLSARFKRKSYNNDNIVSSFSTAFDTQECESQWTMMHLKETDYPLAENQTGQEYTYINPDVSSGLHSPHSTIDDSKDKTTFPVESTGVAGLTRKQNSSPYISSFLQNDSGWSSSTKFKPLWKDNRFRNDTVRHSHLYDPKSSEWTKVPKSAIQRTIYKAKKKAETKSESCLKNPFSKNNNSLSYARRQEALRKATTPIVPLLRDSRSRPNLLGSDLLKYWQAEFLAQLSPQSIGFNVLWTSSMTWHIAALKIYSLSQLNFNSERAIIDVMQVIGEYLVGKMVLMTDEEIIGVSQYDGDMKPHRPDLGLADFVLTNENISLFSTRDNKGKEIRKEKFECFEFFEFRYICAMSMNIFSGRSETHNCGHLLTTQQISQLCLGKRTHSYVKKSYGSE